MNPRNTGLTPKLLGVDARAWVPMFVILFHWAWWTATIGILFVAVFKMLEMRNMNVAQATYRLRAMIAGRVRPARRPGTAAMRMRRGVLHNDYMR